MKAKRCVKDVMHPGVITCAPGTPVVDVIRMMTDKQVHSIVVVEADGQATGIISQSDLLNAGFTSPYSDDFRGMFAWHLMSTPVIAVRPDLSLERAVAILKDRKIHRLVVVRGEGPEPLHPLGVLSVTDLVRCLGEAEPVAHA